MNLTDMKIHIIDQSKEKLKYAELYFDGCDNVECVCGSLDAFLDTCSVDCVVSPANSFGLMDGGYDLALTEYFGKQLQDRVQRYIVEHYLGEQPVGTSFIIESGHPGCFLIHTPSMRTPQTVKDPLVIYQCMRTTLMCAMQNNIESILIPLFGGGCGAVHPRLIAEMMWKAYVQIKDPPQNLSWAYVEEHEIIL